MDGELRVNTPGQGINLLLGGSTGVAAPTRRPLPPEAIARVLLDAVLAEPAGEQIFESEKLQ